MICVLLLSVKCFFADIIAGNAKAIMQLILAIAAHFKPSSIGGRKISHVEKSHGSPAVSAR